MQWGIHDRPHHASPFDGINFLLYDGREGFVLQLHTGTHLPGHARDPNCLVMSFATFLLSILLSANGPNTKEAKLFPMRKAHEDYGRSLGNPTVVCGARCPIKLADHASFRVALYAHTLLFLFSRCSHISNSRMPFPAPCRQEYISRAEKATAEIHGGTAGSSRRCG